MAVTAGTEPLVSDNTMACFDIFTNGPDITPESHRGMLSLHMGVVKAPVCNLYRQPAAWSLSLRGQPLKLRQHLYYVYASLSRLDFRDLPEKFIVVFEGVIGFPAAKKPTALMMHWWNGGRGGV
jgi:hypothetical protein